MLLTRGALFCSAMRMKFKCPRCGSSDLCLRRSKEELVTISNLDIVPGNSEPFFNTGSTITLGYTNTRYACGLCHRVFNTFDNLKPHLTESK